MGYSFKVLVEVVLSPQSFTFGRGEEAHPCFRHGACRKALERFPDGLNREGIPESVEI